MRQFLLSICRQMIANSDRAAVTGAAVILAKERSQRRKRCTSKTRLDSRAASRGKRMATAAVEFVVILPLLIVLCLTSVDFGRFAHAYIALGNAGRAGAEYGATQPYSSSTATAWKLRVEDAVRQDFSAIADIDPAQLEVEINVENDAHGLHRASLTTTYPFQTVVAWPIIPRPLDMQRTIVFRRFR
jgi:Flp pilus assembly protein TadG